MPDLRFMMLLKVNKRREREEKMVTFAASVKYVYIKQWPVSPPPFTSALAFWKKHIFWLFYVLSPAEFSESLTTPRLFKLLQISLEWLNTVASWRGQAVYLQAVGKRPSGVANWLIGWLLNLSYILRCYKRISSSKKCRNKTSKKKYHIFSRVFDIPNQMLTRHLPFAPLGQFRWINRKAFTILNPR